MTGGGQSAWITREAARGGGSVQGHVMIRARAAHTCDSRSGRDVLSVHLSDETSKQGAAAWTLREGAVDLVSPRPSQAPQAGPARCPSPLEIAMSDCSSEGAFGSRAFTPVVACGPVSPVAGPLPHTAPVIPVPRLFLWPPAPRPHPRPGVGQASRLSTHLLPASRLQHRLMAGGARLFTAHWFFSRGGPVPGATGAQKGLVTLLWALCARASSQPAAAYRRDRQGWLAFLLFFFCPRGAAPPSTRPGANSPPWGTATSTRQDPGSSQPLESKLPVRGRRGSSSPATATSQGLCGISHAGPPRQSSLASSPPLLSGALDPGISTVVRSVMGGPGLCRHPGRQVGLVFCWRADTAAQRSTDHRVPCWPGNPQEQ
ncbi:hypothetical protein NDU88_004600 [Pleurodeles waltl]|uniref:Uncharacterized protein n=1 Tax=Pleurodeles waltl TaxID=8319 RepID=A0AAV7L567_PLEWA|nr:hypothetical protein NDU88_004600 [Pleurodeles waltl]